MIHVSETFINKSKLRLLFRKTFGWVTLAFNLLLYLFFVIPLTSLAIYLRANEKRLCGINETLTRKVSVKCKTRELIPNDLACILSWQNRCNSERIKKTFNINGKRQIRICVSSLLLGANNLLAQGILKRDHA